MQIKQLKSEVGLFLEMAKAGVVPEGPWHLLAGLSIIPNCHCCKCVHISKVWFFRCVKKKKKRWTLLRKQETEYSNVFCFWVFQFVTHDIPSFCNCVIYTLMPAVLKVSENAYVKLFEVKLNCTVAPPHFMIILIASYGCSSVYRIQFHGF